MDFFEIERTDEFQEGTPDYRTLARKKHFATYIAPTERFRSLPKDKQMEFVKSYYAPRNMVKFMGAYREKPYRSGVSAAVELTYEDAKELVVGIYDFVRGVLPSWTGVGTGEIIEIVEEIGFAKFAKEVGKVIIEPYTPESLRRYGPYERLSKPILTALDLTIVGGLMRGAMRQSVKVSRRFTKYIDEEGVAGIFKRGKHGEVIGTDLMAAAAESGDVIASSADAVATLSRIRAANATAQNLVKNNITKVALDKLDEGGKVLKEVGAIADDGAVDLSAVRFIMRGSLGERSMLQPGRTSIGVRDIASKKVIKVYDEGVQASDSAAITFDDMIRSGDNVVIERGGKAMSVPDSEVKVGDKVFSKVQTADIAEQFGKAELSVGDLLKIRKEGLTLTAEQALKRDFRNATAALDGPSFKSTEKIAKMKRVQIKESKAPTFEEWIDKHPGLSHEAKAAARLDWDDALVKEYEAFRKTYETSYTLIDESGLFAGRSTSLGQLHDDVLKFGLKEVGKGVDSVRAQAKAAGISIIKNKKTGTYMVSHAKSGNIATGLTSAEIAEKMPVWLAEKGYVMRPKRYQVKPTDGFDEWANATGKKIDQSGKVNELRKAGVPEDVIRQMGIDEPIAAAGLARAGVDYFDGFLGRIDKIGKVTLPGKWPAIGIAKYVVPPRHIMEKIESITKGSVKAYSQFYDGLDQGFKHMRGWLDRKSSPFGYLDNKGPHEWLRGIMNDLSKEDARALFFDLGRQHWKNVGREVPPLPKHLEKYKTRIRNALDGMWNEWAPMATKHKDFSPAQFLEDYLPVIMSGDEKAIAGLSNFKDYNANKFMVDWFARKTRNWLPDAGKNETDLYRVLKHYMFTHARERFMGQVFDDAAKFLDSVKANKEIPRSVHTFLNEFAGDLYGVQRQSAIDIQDAITSAMKRIPGVSKQWGASQSQEVFNFTMMLTHSAALGYRAMPVVRNALQTVITLPAMYGSDNFMQGFGKLMKASITGDEKSVIKLHRELVDKGIIRSKAPGVYAGDDFAEMVHSGKLINGMKKFSRVGLYAYGDIMDSWNRVLSYTVANNIIKKHGERLLKGKYTREEFVHKAGLRNFPESYWNAEGGALKKMIDDVSDGSEAALDDLADRWGQIGIKETQWAYEAHETPMLMRGAGRLVGQFGVWPANYAQFLIKLGKYGPYQQRLKRVATMIGVMKGIEMTFELGFGVDVSRWLYASPLMFGGGPSFSIAKDVSDVVTGPDFKRDIAKQNLINTAKYSFVPASGAVRDLVRGYKTGEIRRSFGFQPHEDLRKVF